MIDHIFILSELERIGKEAVMAYFDIHLEGLRKICQDS
jgi:hypothetical protein